MARRATVMVLAAALVFLLLAAAAPSMATAARDDPTTGGAAAAAASLPPHDHKTPKPASAAEADAGCEGANDEDECMMRRTLAAHTDYIYTQQHHN